MKQNSLHLHDNGVTLANCQICAGYARRGHSILDWPLTAASGDQLLATFGDGGLLPKSSPGRTDHRRPKGRRDAVRPPRP